MSDANEAAGTAPEARRAQRRRRGRRRLLLVLVLVLLVVAVLVTATFIWTAGTSGPPPSKSSTFNIPPSGAVGGSCGTTMIADTYNLTLNPNRTETTATFGVQITNGTGAVAPVETAPTVGSGATLTPKLDACAMPGGGWYAILWSSSGSPVASYGSGGTNGWTALAQGGAAGTLPITVPSGMQFEVISVYSLEYDTLSFVGINGNSVTGSTAL